MLSRRDQDLLQDAYNKRLASRVKQLLKPATLAAAARIMVTTWSRADPNLKQQEPIAKIVIRLPKVNRVVEKDIDPMQNKCNALP